MYLFWTQFVYALKTVLMDIKPIVFRFGVFILMTFILGSAFNSAFSKDDLDPVKVGYVSADDGAVGEEYFARLTAIPEFEDVAEFTEVDTFAEGQQLVEDEELGALLYVDEQFSADVAATDGHGTVGVYLKKYSGINFPIISSIVDSYNSGANVAWAIQSMDRIFITTQVATNDSAIQVEEVTAAREMTGFTYYAVGMLLFMLLYGAEFGSFGGMHQDFLGAVGRRAQLTLVKPWQQYTGKLLAFSLATFAQGAAYVGVTSAFFDVNWGDNLPLTLAVIYVFGVLAIALGMTAMTLTRDEKKTKAIIQVALLGSTFLAGGFVVTSFGAAELASPSYYAREALFSLMFGENTQIALRNLGVISAIAAGLTLTSVIASRRKLA